jgi:hypothetical protein
MVVRLRECVATVLVSLLAATAPLPVPATEPAIAVRGVVIPTGYERGAYSVLIQVVVPGSPLPGATWELSATLASPGITGEEFSGRVSTESPWTPAVLEFQATMKPGPWDITLAAHETTTGQEATGRIAGSLPDRETGSATVSPIATLQPVKGGFLRDGALRPQGALGHGDDDPTDTQLAAALVSVVCRGATQERASRVERRLVGLTPVKFEPIEPRPGGERCAQVRDLIRPGTLTEGSFRYEVKVFEGVREVGSTSGRATAASTSRSPKPGTTRRS